MLDLICSCYSSWNTLLSSHILGGYKTSTLQSVSSCGQFGHLSAFCAVALFPPWLLHTFPSLEVPRAVLTELLISIVSEDGFSFSLIILHSIPQKILPDLY